MASFGAHEYFNGFFTVVLICSFVAGFPVFYYSFFKIGLIDKTLSPLKIRTGIVSVFCISAIITPPDVVSTFLLALPLSLLFMLIIIAFTFLKKEENLQESPLPRYPLIILWFGFLAILLVIFIQPVQLLPILFSLLNAEYIVLLLVAFQYNTRSGILSFLVPFYMSYFILKNIKQLFNNSIFYKIFAFLLILLTLTILVFKFFKF